MILMCKEFGVLLTRARQL